MGRHVQGQAVAFLITFATPPQPPPPRSTASTDKHESETAVNSTPQHTQSTTIAGATRQRRGPGRADRRRTFAGFTLVELLVAIGAVSLLAVGIATIFASISSTVRGGQRVSRLTQQAAAIEARLREDFANLATDGVFVIRHAYADNSTTGALDQFPLAPSSPATSRYRRSDQLVYTVRGTETTARIPLPRAGEQRRQPSADVSLVYLGHGLRWNSQGNPPEPDDEPGTMSSLPTFGDPLNSEARRWMLLRRPVLLAQPTAREPGDIYPDNAIQIGAHPAASSAFRDVARGTPANAQLPPAGEIFRTPRVRPMIASGLTDIATTSLAELVRTVRYASYNTSINAGQIIFTRPFGPVTRPTAVAYRDIHRWMEQLFPASGLGANQNMFDNAPELRPRYEPEPDDLFGTRANSGNVWDVNQDFRLADQIMLTAANFVPNCSEFIVEWSFGQTVEFPTGSNQFVTLWHGRDRTVDGNTVAVRYGGSPSLNGFTQNNVPRKTTTVLPLNSTDGSIQPRNVELNPILVHGIVSATTINELDPRPMYSFFGPSDPFWNPSAIPGTTADDWPAEIPMPWPSMVRITMTLADPQDDTIEQTFQFIFELPRR